MRLPFISCYVSSICIAPKALASSDPYREEATVSWPIASCARRVPALTNSRRRDVPGAGNDQHFYYYSRPFQLVACVDVSARPEAPISWAYIKRRVGIFEAGGNS